jgi:hypothetical protein
VLFLFQSVDMPFSLELTHRGWELLSLRCPVPVWKGLNWNDGCRCCSTKAECLLIEWNVCKERCFDFVARTSVDYNLLCCKLGSIVLTQGTSFERQRKVYLLCWWKPALEFWLTVVGETDQSGSWYSNNQKINPRVFDH